MPRSDQTTLATRTPKGAMDRDRCRRTVKRFVDQLVIEVGVSFHTNLSTKPLRNTLSTEQRIRMTISASPGGSGGYCSMCK